MKRIAIDVGGTNIKWALFDENYQIIEEGKSPTHAFTLKAKGVIKRVAEICNEIESKYYKEIEGVGLSIPGVIDSDKKTTLVPLNNIPGANEINFGEEFKKYSNLRIEIINDAKAAALGEYKQGSLKNYKNSVLITLGTGIGAGIIIDGNLYQGNNFFAGEIGQQKVSNNLKWESTASTRWFVIACNFIKGQTSLTGEEIFKILKNDISLQEEYNNWMNEISLGLANLIYILSPERIAIGGGVSENEIFDIKKLNELVNEKVTFSFNKPTQIVKASLGNKSGLVGAAIFLGDRINETKN